MWCLGITLTLCIFDRDPRPPCTSVDVNPEMLYCATHFHISLTVYQNTNHTNLMFLCNSCQAKLAFSNGSAQR